MTAHAEMRGAIEAAKGEHNNSSGRDKYDCPKCMAEGRIAALAPTWLNELLEENERLRESLASHVRTYSSAPEALVERAALAADAARYRALQQLHSQQTGESAIRIGHFDNGRTHLSVEYPKRRIITGESLDAAIDAALDGPTHG